MRPRVLLIEGNQDGTTGGSHRSLFDLARLLRQRGFETSAVFYEDNAIAAELRGIGIPALVWPAERERVRGSPLLATVAGGLRLLPRIRSRWRYLEAHGISLVHLNNAPTLGFDDWLPAARLARIPCIAHMRADCADFMPRHWLGRVLVRSYDRVIAISNHVVAAAERIGIARRKIDLVYNGIDLAAWRASVRRPVAAVREALGIAPGTFVVAMVGNIREWKGQHVLLDAAGRMGRTGGGLRVLLVGDVARSDRVYFDRLRALVEAAGLQGAVSFLGNRSDVADIMSAADVVVHASVAPEPFGRVILEAMALGKPIIAPMLGGPVEILGPDWQGFYEPGSADDLARQLDRARSDAKWAAVVGAEAAARAEAFDVARTVEGVTRVYGQLLRAVPSAPAAEPTHRPGVPAARAPERKRLRVLMYAKYLPPRFSGAGLQAVTLARALTQRGVQLRLVTERTPEHDAPYDLDGLVVYPSLPAAVDVSPRAVTCALVAREAWRYRASVFHAHSAFPEASAMGVAVQPLGVASLLKVTLQRADLDCSTRFIGPLHRALLRRQTGIVAISTEIATELDGLGIPGDRVLRIPNGVDTGRFRPASVEERARVRGSLGIPASTRVVLFVGMLSRRKNVDWLLDQWARWRASGAGSGDTLLLLAGPPSSEEGDKLEARVRGLTADPAAGVRWVGAVRRTEETYAAADLVILPSTAEGMPNVLLEAMACGLPSAAAESGGCRDLLQGHPSPGWLFAPGDGEALLECLANLGAAARLGEMGAAARRRAEAVYSIPVIAGQYEYAYRRLTGLLDVT